MLLSRMAGLPAHIRTIGLWSDGDDLALLRAIESSFGISFGSETADCRTVGDLYNALLSRVHTSQEPGRCATSMAFYRLKSALLRATGTQAAIAPSTRIDAMTSMAPKYLFDRIKRDIVGVDALLITVSWRGLLGVALFVSGLLLAFYAAWLVLLLPVGAMMVWSDPGTFESMTVGDLAHALATNNYHYFMAAGADARPTTLWRVFCSIIAEQGGVDPKGIGMETRLIR